MFVDGRTENFFRPVKSVRGGWILCALKQVLLFDRLGAGGLRLKGRWHRSGLKDVLQRGRDDEWRCQQL